MSDTIRYSRWHTPRTIVANALDVLSGLADMVLGVLGLYLGFLAASAVVGESRAYGPGDALGLALLCLACLGAGRIVTVLLSGPAEALRPGLGHLPGWAIPARIRDQVHGWLRERGPARTAEIAGALDLPRASVSSALRGLAAEDRAVRLRPGVWATAEKSEGEGPQVPVIGGDAQ